MMRPPPAMRRRYLLFSLRVPRRWVKGFGKRAGTGPVSSDKLLRMHRAQQKFLAHRHERRAVRRELERDDLAADVGSMLQYRRSGPAWTASKRKRMRKLYKRALRRLFDGLRATGYRMPSGDVLLAPGHEIRGRGGFKRIARLSELREVVRIVVVDRQLDDATFAPGGRVLY